MPCKDNVVAATSEVGALVHLQSNAMAKSMSEVLLPIVRFQYHSSGLVRGPGVRPIFGSLQGGSLSISNRMPNMKLSFGESGRRKSECLMQRERKLRDKSQGVVQMRTLVRSLQ